MVDFAGWQMPVQYTSIIAEHNAVRDAAGLFDIAHMGRLRFSGADACRFLDHIVTNDVTKLNAGQIRYALVTSENGGILDDVLVYRFQDHYLLVVNASNRQKILDWINRHRFGFDVEVEDLTSDRFMLALQGPHSARILRPHTTASIESMQYYTGCETVVLGNPAIVSRTGYTGEDGFELIVSSEHAESCWRALMRTGAPVGLRPAGLGCRDTLRLEAAMPLYGHELSETIDPFTAGLSFGVKLKAGDFIGRDALVAAAQQTDRRVRVGLELAGRRIAREGARVLAGESIAGTVTSGTFSPTLQRSIAMAYLNQEHARTGTVLHVDIRGKREPAAVVALPFYSRSRSS